MAFLNIPKGKSEFEKIRREGLYYVDKTGLIGEILKSSGTQVTLITRPRRFGKTLGMSTLECFLDIQKDSKSLFEGLEISKQKDICDAWMNQWPVMSLSLKAVEGNDFSTAYEQFVYEIGELYKKHEYLMQSSVLNEEEKKLFWNIAYKHAGKVEVMRSLQILSEFLNRHYHKNVILLIDEYDVPMAKATSNGYYKEMLEIMKGFMQALKDNPYLQLAVVTGCLKIAKESIFTGTNNFVSNTITSSHLNEYYGFVQSEVDKILEDAGIKGKKEVIKKWYDGFVFGGKKDIYNPWSITNFLDKRKIDIYWANTSSNSLIGHLIQRGNSAIKEAMEDLLSGKELVTEIDEQIVFDQLDDNMTAIWSLLLSSGYLKINQAPKDAAASNQNYHLSLTNHEVDVMFRRMIDGWFKKYTPNYNAFVKALLADDVRAMNHYINRIALETFSFFDTGKGPSASAEPEHFYHGFVLGLMVDLQDKYHITSNRESGFGRYDIMLEPVEIGQSDAIILEFKVIDPESEADLNATVNSALEQIRHKQYDAQLLARGFRPDQIRAYGFAFQGKQVLIGK